MKDLSLLVWLTQLGITVAFPIAGFVLIGVWLNNRFHLGTWVIIAGLVIGLCSAITGLRSSLKTLERLSKGKKDDTPPPISFNDHH